MSIQRLGDDANQQALYGASGTVAMDWYFRGVSRLGPVVMRYVIPTGAAEGLHFHEAEHPDSCTPDSVDELYVITRGTVTVSVDGQASELGVGDAFYARAGSLHGVVNSSDEPAELILVFGPIVQSIEPAS